MVFKIRGEGIDLIRLIGAFVLFAAILMFFHAASVMFESWTNIKLVNNCLVVAGDNTEFFKECQQAAINSLGVFPRPDQSALNGKQLYSALAPPISSLFLWIAVLLFGIFLYNFRRLFAPVTAKAKPIKRKK